MAVYQDFEDLLRCLNGAKVRYLIVGAHAVAFYTEPRYTKEDIWVDPDPKNAERVYKALGKFGAPLQGLKVEDLTNPKLVYQIGVAPVRVDIIMGIGYLKFSEAWRHKRAASFGKEKMFVLGIKELITAKKAASRPQDKLDLDKLQKRSRSLKR